MRKRSQPPRTSLLRTALSVLFTCVVVAGYQAYLQSNGYQLYLKKNRGFSPWKTTSISLNREELALPSEEMITSVTPAMNELTPLLSQNFTFLGRGVQCYAFLGEDGETVLKIFKNYRYTTHEILRSLLPSTLQKRLSEKTERRKNRLIRFYRGCVVAAYEIPDLTLVKYIHLFPTENLKVTLNLKDRLGLEYKIEADTTQFLLQKRITVADSLATQLIQEGNQQGFEEMLIATEEMMLEQYKHGIGNRDFAFDKNVGFFNGKAILIDVGSIIKKDNQDPAQKKELALATHQEMNDLKKFLLTHYPDGATWIDLYFEENPVHLAYTHYLEKKAEKNGENL